MEAELQNTIEAGGRTEAENCADDAEDTLLQAGIEVVNDEGIRMQADAQAGEESDTEEGVTSGQKKKALKEVNTHEARFLNMFVCTKACRRKVWNHFFKNNEKRE